VPASSGWRGSPRLEWNDGVRRIGILAARERQAVAALLGRWFGL
jgi:hypothetical protein